MTPHIPEEFSTKLIDWSPFVIMGNTMALVQQRPDML
jgi:hypothetical protein